MQIGIITFHNADNYGAVLQCYALQQFLMKMGHETRVIDYRNAHIESLYIPTFGLKKFLLRLLSFKFGDALQYSRDYKTRCQKRASFKYFRKRYLNLTERINQDKLPQDLDVYIIGSDQMWTVKCAGGYDPVFWGNFDRPIGSRLIGYAISSQADFVSSFSLEDIERQVSLFDELSFREKKISDLVFRITKRLTSITIDPTLLSDESIWSPLLDNKWANRKYVIVYEVRKKGTIEEKAIEYARQHNLELINLTRGGYGVEDFVSLIKYAQCVITTSFHATVFSVIFRTPFCSIQLNDGGDDRYVSLLKHLGLMNHVFEKDDCLKVVPKVNNDNLDVALHNYRFESLDFLHKNLLHE